MKRQDELISAYLDGTATPFEQDELCNLAKSSESIRLQLREAVSFESQLRALQTQTPRHEALQRSLRHRLVRHGADTTRMEIARRLHIDRTPSGRSVTALTAEPQPSPETTGPGLRARLRRRSQGRLSPRHSRRKRDSAAPVSPLWLLVAAGLILAVGVHLLHWHPSAGTPSQVARLEPGPAMAQVIRGTQTIEVAGREIPLLNGDIVSAMGAGPVRLRYLDEETHVTLSENTAVQIQVQSSAKHLLLREGRVVADVQPLPNRKVVISTTHLTAEALGTRFEVTAAPELSQVVVMQSRVRVTERATGRTIVAAPGETVQAGSQLALGLTRSTVPERALTENETSPATLANESEIAVTRPKLNINCGGEAFVAPDGAVFIADRYFEGGNAIGRRERIAGTDLDSAFNCYRFGSFTYRIPLTNGRYRITLGFAELVPEKNRRGVRAFDVELQGRPVARRICPLQEVGYLSAYQRQFDADVVDGWLVLALRDSDQHLSGADGTHPILNVLRIEPIDP